MDAKRIFDAAVSAVLILIASPLMAAIALAIRAFSGSPVLYRQKRAGKDGVSFVIYKFRSMRNGTGKALDVVKKETHESR